MRKSEIERTEARAAATEKRRALLEAEKSLDLFKRAEMLQAAGEIRTTDGARLSPKNTILVYMQASAAGVVPSVVGGFKQWREAGRTVRKGARGLLICFPKVGKNEESGADELHGFGWGYVFDISQTCGKGEEGPEEKEEEKEEEKNELKAAAAEVQAEAPEAPKAEAPKAEAAPAATPGSGLAAVLAAIAAA